MTTKPNQPQYNEQTTPGGIVIVTIQGTSTEPPEKPAGSSPVPKEWNNGKCPVCGSDSPQKHEMTCMCRGNAVHCDDCGWRHKWSDLREWRERSWRDFHGREQHGHHD